MPFSFSEETERFKSCAALESDGLAVSLLWVLGSSREGACLFLEENQERQAGAREELI